jgi:hypothetical protein
MILTVILVTMHVRDGVNLIILTMRQSLPVNP